MKRPTILHFLAAAAMMGSAGASVIYPGLSNPGFELGNFTDWTVTVTGPYGGAGIFTTTPTLDGAGFDGFDNWAPVEAGHFAVLRGGIANVYQKISTLLTATAGDHVVFSVFLDTSDERAYLPFGINDDGYAKLVNTTTLAETTLFAASVSSLPNRGNTGWVTVNYVIPAAGTYRLEFGVRNVGDAAGSVIMGVDAARFTAAITSATAGEKHIGFAAMPGLAYTIQYKNALTDAAWLHLADIAAPAAAQAIDYNDTSVGLAPQRFYRVVTPQVP